MTPVLEGSIIAGKYRVERVLGQGGMGVVVQAVHLQLDQRVAIKFLLPSAIREKEAVVRFAREARAAVRIKSEHVAQVLDVGTLEDGMPYMVMEYLEGSDLSSYVEQRGALPVPEAVEVVLQACEALADAHLLGIVHRDLKPANLFLTLRRDGTRCVKVLDFGISKVQDPERGTFDMTKTTAVMGSPFYMSPEQMRSTRHVDARADIWSLGVILFEIVTGRVPFDAETMPQLCGMILQEPPPPLRQLRPDLPPAFEAIVLRCLEKDRERRFGDVRELAAALAPFADAEARRSIDRIARVLGHSSAPPQNALAESNPTLAEPSGAAVTQTAFNQTNPKGARSRGVVAAFGLAGLALAVGGAFLILRSSAGSAELESASPPNVHSGAPVPPSAQSAEEAGKTGEPNTPSQAPEPEPTLEPRVAPAPSASAAPATATLKTGRPRRPPPSPKSPADSPAAAAPEPARPQPAPRPTVNPLDGRM